MVGNGFVSGASKYLNEVHSSMVGNGFVLEFFHVIFEIICYFSYTSYTVTHCFPLFGVKADNALRGGGGGGGVYTMFFKYFLSN